MPRANELEDFKTHYKALIDRDEREPIPKHGDTKTWPINSSALAIMIVGARLAKILIDLGIILAVIVREQRWLRMVTQGEYEKAILEQRQNKSVIYRPGRL